jgi:hypothetical protein
MVRKALSSRNPLVSNELNYLCKHSYSNIFAVFENDISSVALEQSSLEDVLAAGMLVADVLMLADDFTPY